MQIDAHQHFWNPARGDYGWMDPSNATLYRLYGPDDLRPHLARHVGFRLARLPSAGGI